MKTKKIFLVGFVLILLGVFTAYKMYNKPHLNVDTTKPDVIVNAQKLIDDFSNDESKANTKYLEQVVNVTGVLKSVINKNGKFILSIGKQDAIESVMCHLEASQNTKVAQLKTGETVSVKGICTGYLMDVILVKGVLTN